MSNIWDQNKSLLGTDRFVIERRLGEGSMGAVYLAYDRERKSQVALKTLRRVDALGIYRFKREFRALADLNHPNLVTLHELFSEGDQWFFTMEYIEGKDFLSYVLGGTVRDLFATPLRGSDSWANDPSRPGTGGDPRGSREQPEPRIEGLEMLFPTPLRNPNLLREVLIQITEGLSAVHAAGKLHRDLKPDNVLVRKDGRAVLLDFGVVSDEAGETHRTLDPGVLGTPAYMAPEQAAGKPVDEASDFYALGAMTYEALTGTIPFDGTYTEVLQQKQRADPPPPSQVVSGVPADLEALCMSLLSRDPTARPRGDAVMRALRTRKQVSLPPQVLSHAVREGAAPFVGRVAELGQLKRSLSASDAGRPVVALISGPSGIGKTTLALHFVDQLAADGGAVVLKGRCYERESVPFKAIDSLVDALSRYLRRLSAVQVAEVMPRDIVALAQLFPVLKRVEEVSAAKRRGGQPSDPQELRRRAFAALKELLSRVADRNPLVLFIDDLQWGDVDSAKLLVDMVTGPDCPAALLLCAFRSGELETSPCLRTLLGHLHHHPQMQMHELSLGALSHAESLDLAHTLIGSDAQVDVAAVGKEAQGSPFLLTELVRYVNDTSTQADRAVSLEQALLARLAALSPDARTLLQLVSVAGRPVPEDTLALASAFNIDLQSALAELRAAKLVRGVATRDARAVETYHDRVRESVVAQLAPELLAIWHRRLASTLEASGSLDLEALTDHLLGAGESARAGLYALRAAAQAERVLAFDKAARLYGIAVVHHKQSDSDRRELLMRWCEALVNAGQGAQAAHVYLEASQLAEGDEAFELRRKAGIQLVLSGQLESGVEILRDTLLLLGVELAVDFQAAVRELIELRERVSARGFDFVPRNAAQLPVETLRRLDALWGVTLGLLISEIDRPLPLIARYLLDALEVGEPERVLQALCLYQAYVESALNPDPVSRSRAALDAAIRLAKDESMHAKAFMTFVHGYEAYRTGERDEALIHLQRAEALFSQLSPGGFHERRLCRQLLSTLHAIFAQPEGLQSVETWARQAEHHDDVLLATRLRLHTTLLWLVRGEVDGAQRTWTDAATRVRRDSFDATALFEWIARVQIALYQGDTEACARHAHELADFESSPFAIVPLLRGQALLMRAAAALAGIEARPDPELLLTRAAADLHAVAELGLRCFVDHTKLARAALAARRGHTEAALELLGEVLISDAMRSQPLLMAAALRRRAELGQRPQDRDEVTARADDMMREFGVQDPTRLANTLAPSLTTQR